MTVQRNPIEPPTGTVTFLFTDVAGSTRLWQEHPTEMDAALARHDEIMRATIGAHRGYIFSTAGDAFAASFARPGDAVDAAVEAQQGLAAEPWPSDAAILVRMGIHTGEAVERGGDYFGPTLNLGARIMSAGHGGQVLISAIMASVVARPSTFSPTWASTTCVTSTELSGCSRSLAKLCAQTFRRFGR